MKLSVVIWEPDNITYSAGFYVRENESEYVIAADYNAYTSQFEGLFRIPKGKIRDIINLTVRKTT